MLCSLVLIDQILLGAEIPSACSLLLFSQSGQETSCSTLCPSYAMPQ